MNFSKKAILLILILGKVAANAMSYDIETFDPKKVLDSDESFYMYQQYEVSPKDESLFKSADTDLNLLRKPVFVCIDSKSSANCKLFFIKKEDSAASEIKKADILSTATGEPQYDPLAKYKFPDDNFFKKTEQFKYKNENKSFKHKFLHSSKYIAGLEVGMLTGLLVLPKSFTNWGDNSWTQIKSNYRRAWTQAPVWDKDSWIINYISHPHSGSVYYNFMRSQNATPWESLLFGVVQSTLWEYVWEAPFEQPSINDLIATPLAGAILGELSHRATIAMRKNGFKWYEKAAVIVINPAYWINNGFRTK